MDLFESAGTDDAGIPADSHAPLAVRMRPRTLDELQGQAHLLAPGSPLRRLVEPAEAGRGSHAGEQGGAARPSSSSLSSVILWGPPGTGKTMTASVIASELSLPMYTVRLDSLLSKFMGETASKLRLVFDSVAQRRGVYLFDEFDALGGDRSGNDVGEARRILNSFLVFLEKASTESLVLAATNHRAILDKALFRRFDMVLDYALPDARQAAAVMKARLGTLAAGISMARLGEHTAGLSHAELVKAAETAAKAVLMRGDKQVRREDLVAALTARRAASLS